MTDATKRTLAKVPAVTAFFWIVKIVATTLGETGGDAVSMTLDTGYAIASAIFISVFLVAVAAQISVRKFHPFLYWGVIVASTTAGTTMADFADRSLGIGYTGGSALLLALLLVSLGIWHGVAGSVSVSTVTNPRVEMFYWVAVLFSQTLGTALGDWMADSAGLGYLRGAAVFGAGLAVIAVCYRFTRINSTLLFWGAFILTRPLGATVGDLLDKPLAKGGLNFDRFTASAAFTAFIIAGILLIPQRAGKAVGEEALGAGSNAMSRSHHPILAFSFTLFLAAGTAIFLVWSLGRTNEDVVVENTLYRSAQLSVADLERDIAANHIKTVLNLRGENEQAAWYQQEVGLCRRLGVKHLDVSFSARSLPKPAEVALLLHDYQNAARPILLHCRAGSDRTGLAAAVYLIDCEHVPWKLAEKTLSWRHGHLAVYPYFEMDEFIQLYGESNDKSFSNWAINSYPAVYVAESKETTWDEFCEPIAYLFTGRVETKGLNN